LAAQKYANNLSARRLSMAAQNLVEVYTAKNFANILATQS
jgi:hypothetical protein